MPSVKQLRVFASIARHGNLGAAAQELCLSKGAVSQALSELERRLGTPVFDRVHPRLRLNDQGRQLQPLAEEVLGRVFDIQHLFDDGGVASGILRLGASQTIGNYLLPSMLPDLSGVDAQIEIQNTHDLCERLARFELDIALIEGKNAHPDLTTQFWRADEMVIVAEPGHPLAQKRQRSLQDLRQFDWVLREPNSGSRAQFDLEVRPFVEPLGRVQILNSLEAIMYGVEHGLGLTFISRIAVQERLQSQKLVQIDVGQTFTRHLSLIWHRQKFLDAVMRRFIAFVMPDSL